MNVTNLRMVAAAVGGAVMNFVVPVVPYAALCTAMVLADVVTAYTLSRRVRRHYVAQGAGLLKSRRLGRALVTLGKVYALLLIASGVDALLVPDGGWSALRFATGAVCLWQGVSVLENESSCSDAEWARIARKWLVDKARRHLG